MARRHIQGRGLDTEAFASNLREIADGLEDGSIGVDSIAKRETANADDLTEFGLTLDFVATHDVSHAVTSLPYVGVDQYLRFLPEYIPEIANGEKRETLRYDLERSFSCGDRVDLQDLDGDKFGEVTIDGVMKKTVQEAVDMSITPYDSSNDAVVTLRGLYGDRSIDSQTFVTLLTFTDVDLDVGVDPDE